MTEPTTEFMVKELLTRFKLWKTGTSSEYERMFDVLSEHQSGRLEAAMRSLEYALRKYEKYELMMSEGTYNGVYK